MLFLLFAITFKFSRARKKVPINCLCSFLFLNYGNKSQTAVNNEFNAQNKLKIFLKGVTYF